MWGKALSLIFVISGLILAGCSSAEVQSPGNIPGVLPALPEASFQPDVTTPPHAASAQAEVVIHGDDYLVKSADSAPGINSLYLVAPAGVVAWAVYEIPNLVAGYRPQRIDLEFQELSNEYYIALANYDLHRW